MSGWSIPLDRLANKYGARVEDVARKATLDTFRSVGDKSPIDTGRFRANWNVSYGSANYSTTSSTNATRVQAEVSKAMTLPVGGVVYMSNGLPYARRLENGHSRIQAPRGMVRLSALEFSRTVNRALR